MLRTQCLTSFTWTHGLCRFEVQSPATFPRHFCTCPAATLCRCRQRDCQHSYYLIRPGQALPIPWMELVPLQGELT